MMSVLCLIVTSTLPVAESPTIEEVIAAWNGQETKSISADIEWQVNRDSRTLDLRHPHADKHGPTWRLRFHGERFRLDGWQPIMSADDMRPDRAAVDKQRSRAEFLAYLQSGFEAPARVPDTRPYTAILSATSHWPAGWGVLDRLTAAAPLLALRPFSNPLLTVQPDHLEMTQEAALTLAGEKLLIVRETLPEKDHREFWLSREPPYRPLRMLEFAQQEIVKQIDFRYSADDTTIPRHWTVQVFNPNHRYLKFAEVSRVELDTSFDPAPGVFSPSADSFLEREIPTRGGIWPRIHTILQWLLSWPGMVFLAVTAWAYVVIRRRPRKPAVAKASEPSVTPLSEDTNQDIHAADTTKSNYDQD